jgi:protease I
MRLEGRTVGILVEQQYQEMEVWVPLYRLREEGATVRVIGTVPGRTEPYPSKLGYPCSQDVAARDVDAASLDAIVIPGGWAPDFLRRHEDVTRLVSEMDARGAIVAAICHAGWVLASAGILRGRRATCFAAIKDDVVNAGAEWVDAEVCVDRNLITSRKPDDLPAFCRALVGALVDAPAKS